MKDEVKSKTVFIIAIMFFVASVIPVLGPMLLACSIANSFDVFRKYGINIKDVIGAIFYGQLMYFLVFYVVFFSLLNLLTFSMHIYALLGVVSANYLVAVILYLISLYFLQRKKVRA